MPRAKQTLVWSRKEKERQNLWVMKRSKCQVMKDQVCPCSISFTLPRQSNYANRSCFKCRSPSQLVWDCPKDISKSAWKGGFKHQRGDGKEGRWGPSKASCHSANIPRRDSLYIKTLQKNPFYNPDPLTHWSGPKTLPGIESMGENSWVLLDNGSTINAVTPEFVEAQSFDVIPLGDLVNGMMGINGFGGLFFWPLSYIIIRVQVEGVKGCDKYQVALVVRFNCLWITSASYSGHTNQQWNHKCDQREQNRWVVVFLEWVKSVPLVGMLLSRTLC